MSTLTESKFALLYLRNLFFFVLCLIMIKVLPILYGLMGYSDGKRARRLDFFFFDTRREILFSYLLGILIEALENRKYQN